MSELKTISALYQLQLKQINIRDAFFEADIDLDDKISFDEFKTII